MNFLDIIPRETRQILTHGREGPPFPVLLHGELWHAALNDYRRQPWAPTTEDPTAGVVLGAFAFVPSTRRTQCDWRIFKDKESATQAESRPDATDRNSYLTRTVYDTWAGFELTPYGSVDESTFSVHQMALGDVVRRADENGRLIPMKPEDGVGIERAEDWLGRLIKKLDTLPNARGTFQTSIYQRLGMGTITWHRKPEDGLLEFKERPATMPARRGARP